MGNKGEILEKHTLIKKNHLRSFQDYLPITYLLPIE